MLFLVAGALLIAAVWLWRAPIQQYIRKSATLADNAPTSDAVADMIEQAANPRAALLAAWNSGKIVHREVAIHELPKIFPVRTAFAAPIQFASPFGGVIPI